MEHPLLALMTPGDLPEPEQDELLRSVGALQSVGWTRERVGEAIRTAIELAGRAAARNQRPIVIYCDQEPNPYVAIRLPITSPARAATDMSRRLRGLLEGRGLDRPGLSISFWSTTPRERSQRSEQ